MSHEKRTDERKIQTIENWIQSYTDGVLRLAMLYTDTLQSAEDLTVNSFTYAYRRMDLAHVYLTDKNALYGGVVTACRGYDAASEIHARTSGENGQTRIPDAPPENESPGERSSIDATIGEHSGRRTGLVPDHLRHLEDDADAGVQPVLSAIRHLSPDLRMVLLLSTIGELSISDMSRILLLPKRMVGGRLRTAWEQVHLAVPSPVTGEFSNLTVPEMLRRSVEKIHASEALMIRIHKVVSATIQEVRAERRHRGPGWLKYATIATGLFCIIAVDMGYHAVHATSQPVTVPTSPAQQTTGLPSPLTGLPVTTEFQFSLSSMPDAASLNHMALGDQGMYLPTLQESANSWPSIQVQFAPYSSAGKSFSQALQPLAAIDMVPPIDQKSVAPNSSSEWKVVSWTFDVTGEWAVASVHWMSGQSMNTVTQVYLLYLPSGASNLVLTVGDSSRTGSTSASPAQVVAGAGGGRVIVQKAIASVVPTQNQTTGSTGTNAANSTGTAGSTTSGGTSSTGTSSLVGLPVDVYQLKGTNPLKALGTPNQIPALFGLMRSPTVFSSGVLSMGVAGQPTDASEANAAWYFISWNGDLTQYVGPPIDGQTHYAVQGSSADLWWAETTPNQGAESNARWQVLMSPLTGDSAGQSAALNLNGPVDWFGASGSHVSWVQDTDGQLQLVVAAVR